MENQFLALSFLLSTCNTVKVKYRSVPARINNKNLIGINEFIPKLTNKYEGKWKRRFEKNNFSNSCLDFNDNLRLVKQKLKSLPAIERIT